MGGVEEISSKCCKFFNVKNLFFIIFESIKFQRENVWKRVFRFIESLRCMEEKSLSY